MTNQISDLNPTDLASIISAKLADNSIQDDEVLRLAERLIVIGFDPKRIEQCEKGICIDFDAGLDALGSLVARLAEQNTLRDLGVFPEGIISPENFRVKASLKLSSQLLESNLGQMQ